MVRRHYSIGRDFVMFILVFFFIYAPRINSVIVLNTSIASLLFLCLLNFRSVLNTLRIPVIQIIFIFFGFLCVYNFLIALLNGNNPVYFSQITLSVVSYTFFGSLIHQRYFNSGETNYEKILSFLKLILSCIFTNSLIILLEYVIPSFKQFIEALLFNDFSNENLFHYADHPFWIRGLASAGGAGQSIFGAIGILIIALLRRENTISFPKSFLFASCTLLSLIFIGRSGLILGIGFFIMYIVDTFWRLGKKSTLVKLQTLSFFTIFFGVIFFIFQLLEFDQEHISWAFEWFDFSSGGIKNTGSTDELKGYLFLPNNFFDSFFGVGFFEGTNRSYERSDSGYIKSIFSIGIPLAIVMYSMIFYLVSKIRVKRINFTFFTILITISLLVTEIKEPIIYQNFVGRFLFAFIGFAFTNISTLSLTKVKQQVVN